MKWIYLIIALIVVPCAGMAGTVYYADPTATSSTNVGTFANPFKTTAAINAKTFASGDDLYFRVGTTWYVTEQILIDWNGSEADRVTIGAYYGENQFGLSTYDRPTFDGNKTYPLSYNQAIIMYIGPGYITVENLHIKESYGTGIQVCQIYYSDNRVSTNNIIRNNIVESSGRQGICLARSSYSLVENNIVDEASLTPVMVAAGVVRYAGAGLEVTGMNNEAAAYNVVRGNTVRRCNESIGLYRGTRYVIVEDNTVYDVSQVAIYSGNARDGVIRNNTLYMVNPMDSLNWRQPERGRGSGIWLDSEDNTTEAIKVTGGWQIYGNYIAGFRQGIWIQCNSNAHGVYQKNNKIFENRIVDCDRNFFIYQAVTGWTGNDIHDNYSFIHTAGLVHVDGDMSPIGVTWSGNHYNTAHSTVTGNAATGAVYNNPVLVTSTGWRDLPVNGSVTAARWAFTSEPAPTPPSESTLNSANAYAGATYTPLRAYLFDDRSGTILTDHSSAGADAALTYPVWAETGLTMASEGQIISAPVPSLGASHTVFMAFTSQQTAGNDYGKLWYYYNSTVRDWQVERYTADTEIRSDVGNVTMAWPGLKDTFDHQFHTVMVTYDDANNQRCLYVDGSLQSCQTSAYANPTWTGNFTIGGKPDGTRTAGVTLHAWYAWNAELAAADALSLHNDYDQLFTDPPARTLNIPIRPVKLGIIQGARPFSIMDSARPMATALGN
jgi:parallel beta-helix repeat protein